MTQKTKIFTALIIALTIAPCFAAQYTGTVVDETGEPLIGVNIVGADRSGCVTDPDGVFTCNLQAPKATVSYMGYETKTVSLSENNNNKIVLAETAQQLQEIVVKPNPTKATAAVTEIKVNEKETPNTENMKIQPVDAAQKNYAADSIRNTIKNGIKIGDTLDVEPLLANTEMKKIISEWGNACKEAQKPENVFSTESTVHATNMYKCVVKKCKNDYSRTPDLLSCYLPEIDVFEQDVAAFEANPKIGGSVRIDNKIYQNAKRNQYGDDIAARVKSAEDDFITACENACAADEFCLQAKSKHNDNKLTCLIEKCRPNYDLSKDETKCIPNTKVDTRNFDNDMYMLHSAFNDLVKRKINECESKLIRNGICQETKKTEQPESNEKNENE